MTVNAQTALMVMADQLLADGIAAKSPGPTGGLEALDGRPEGVARLSTEIDAGRGRAFRNLKQDAKPMIAVDVSAHVGWG